MAIKMTHSGYLILISLFPVISSATCKHSISSTLERRYEINMGYGSLKLLKLQSIKECTIMCMISRECGAINYNGITNYCELLEAPIGRPLLVSSPATPKTSIDWSTYSIKARYPADAVCSVLSNGGFEETKDWTSLGTGYTYSNSDSVAGSRSVAITPNGAATQTVTFKNGTTSFTVAAWSKSTGVGSPSDNNFYGISTDVTFDDGSSLSVSAMNFPDVTPVWQQQVTRFDAPEGRFIMVASVTLRLDNYGSGTAFFDNVIVAHGDLTCTTVTGNASHLCVPSVVSDPSFETGGSGWQLYNPGSTYTTEDAHSWAHSIKLVNGLAFYHFKFPVDMNVRTLTMQAYSKPSGVPGPGSIDYSLYCDTHLANGTWVTKAVEPYPVSGSEWTLKTTIATLGQNTDYVLCHLIYRNFASGHAYFDDMKVFVDGMTCM